MLISPADLNQLIEQEVIEDITRGDENKATQAIKQAISEAKAYLSRYNLVALFGIDADAMDNSDDSSVAPTVQDDYLKEIIINLACWKLVKLCNANLYYDTFKYYYEDTIKKLTKIQSGVLLPEGWPFATVSDTPVEGNAISVKSNPKMNNLL
jgi:phage gp36-like protein